MWALIICSVTTHTFVKPAKETPIFWINAKSLLLLHFCLWLEITPPRAYWIPLGSIVKKRAGVFFSSRACIDWFPWKLGNNMLVKVMLRIIYCFGWSITCSKLTKRSFQNLFLSSLLNDDLRRKFYSGTKIRLFLKCSKHVAFCHGKQVGDLFCADTRGG